MLLAHLTVQKCLAMCSCLIRKFISSASNLKVDFLKLMDITSIIGI